MSSEVININKILNIFILQIASILFAAVATNLN